MFMDNDRLKVGAMSNAELAEWFGTTTLSINKNKKKWLKKLEEYCRWESKWGGINIVEVYMPYYRKNKNYAIAAENYLNFWDESGLDTSAHVGKQIHDAFEEELTVKTATTINHVRQAKNIDFGRIYKGAPKDWGSKGYCHYVLCKKDGKGQPIPLTKKEEEIKDKLLKKWLGDTQDKITIVQNAVKNKELPEEKAWREFSNLTNLPRKYEGFMNEFKKETGVQLIRGTYLEKNEESAWSNDDNDKQQDEQEKEPFNF